MRVQVTGAAGFIGSNLTDRLLSAVLHWKPKASVREGLMRMVDYFRDAPGLPSRGGV